MQNSVELPEALATVLDRQLAQFVKEQSALRALLTVMLEHRLGRSVNIGEFSYDPDSRRLSFSEEASEEEGGIQVSGEGSGQVSPEEGETSRASS